MWSVTRISLLVCAFLTFAHLATAANPPAKRARNVILITLDTVRADHLGCYGNKNIQTPTLDALGHDGVLFERAIGVQDFTGEPLDSRFRSVAQAFKQHGYATAAVVSAFVLDRSWGLARGFDFYDDAFASEAFAKGDIGLVDRRAGESVDHALAWLKKNQLRPFFFWLHLYDPHSPYDPPEPFRSQYQGHLYDGEIAYADHELGRLLAWLKQTHLYDSSLILFLSDHGESLGEHGEHEHGFFVYNATVHVPLIVKPAADSGIRPGRTTRSVETTAVAPTLLEAAGIHDGMGQQMQSHSLLDAATSLDDVAYSETFYPFSSFGWSPLHALETTRYHYIDAPQPELYDLAADPGEEHNLATQQTATIAVLKNKLQMMLANNPYSPGADNNSRLSPDAIDKLRALGYVAFRSPVPAGALISGLPDPKSKLEEFNSILEAEDALQKHDDDEADALLRKVQERDPNIYVIPFLLGESAVRHEKWQEAVDQLQRCLKLNPNFDNAMTGLARALDKLGHADDARTWLEKAVSINPQNYRAWYETGLLDAVSNPAAALSSYQEAVAVQPNFYPGQRELGMALFNQKDYVAAAPHLEKAITLGLEDAHLHNYLGICYSRTNRLEKAVRNYRIALKLDPGLAEAHLNLAFALQRMQEPAAAATEYEAACKLEKRFCEFVPRH